MKKQARSKASKAERTDLPELVTVMAKLVERLEALEKKTDLVISRIATLPQEMRRACQDVRRPEPSPHVQPLLQSSGQGSPQNHGPRERILYQAVCADCRKHCEVPFKPTGERPVYCKECFARRKSGNAPKAPAGSCPPSELPQKEVAASQKPSAFPARKADDRVKKAKPPKKKKKR